MRFSERESTAVDRMSILLSIICQDLRLGIHYSEPDIYVAKVDIVDAKGCPITSGAGKGAGAQLGAVAEALEHYTFTAKLEKIIGLSKDDIVRQPSMQNDGLVQSMRKLDAIGPLIECVEFEPLYRDSHTLKVPAVLVSYEHMQRAMGDLNHRLSYLAKYFTNSGVALGVGMDESILHGINEAFERDYLSEIYRHLSQGTLPSLVKISEQWLNRNLKSYREIGGLLQGVDIYYGDWKGLPFGLCVSRNKASSPMALVGSGCSVDVDVALDRAITEWWQVSNLQSAQDAKMDLSVSRILTTLNLESLISLENLQNIEKVDLGPLKPMSPKTVREQISHVMEKLRNKGLEVFFRKIECYRELVNITQVYIPGLDRFHLIRAGSLVVPNSVLLEHTY